MDRITLRAVISIGCAAAIGFLLVYATEIGLGLCILMPTLCFLQNRRIHAFLVAFAYYGAASSILIPAILSFFGQGTTLQLAFTLWATACLLLALPFGALWSSDRNTARWRAPLAVLGSVPPPLGIIGWANPLTSTGMVFPGTSWFGLIATLTFVGLSTRYRKASLAVLFVAALVANVVFAGIPPTPNDWEAVDTFFGDTSPRGASMLKQYEIAQSIQQRALESHARVIVFPETVISPWTEATDLFWEPTLARLAATGKTLLIGAAMEIPSTNKYRNVMVLRGAQNGILIQRIPVPIGMWRPFDDDGVPLSLSGPASIKESGNEITVLICYEQFLTWTLLTSVASGSGLIVGTANHYWSRGTNIPKVQSTLLRVWARLFEIPYTLATNF